MPFRARIKRAFGKSDKGHPVDPPSPAGERPLEATPVTEAVEETEEEPQSLALQDLWSDAYILLQDEDLGHIAAYEQSLIASQQGDHQPQYPPEATDISHQKSLQLLVQRRLDEIEKSRLTVSVGGRQIAVRDQARRIVHAVLSVKDMINLAVSVEPHASLAWAGVLVFLNPVANAFTQEEDALEGFEYISHLMVRFKVIEATRIEIRDGASSAGPLGDLGAALRSRIVKLYAQVLKYQIRLAKHYAHSTFFRSLHDLAVSDNWKDMLLTITDMEKGISGDLEIFAGHAIQRIDMKVEELGHLMNKSLKVANETRDEVNASKQLLLLESLPCATGAIFGSFEDQHKPLCLEGTQTHILKQIGDWCEDSEGKPIFWLKGMAGTGKTTISRTFTSACRDGTHLMAAPEYSLPNTFCLVGSFFFDRTKPDRNNASKVFPTISRTLADVLPGVRDHICEAITKNPNIGNESLSRQWEHLIFHPLIEWERQQELLPLVLIFVLDAIDECQNEGDLRLIFRLMSQVRQLNTIRLRVFITSRSDVPVRLGIRESFTDVVQDEVLDKVSTTVTGEDDITIYILHELAKIRKKRPDSEDWLDPRKLKMLVEKADGLFIYAATACRFLGGARSRGQLDKRLDMIFDSRITGASPQGSLDQIYTHIMQCAISGEDILDEEKEELAYLFRQSVGSMIILFEPIGVAALSGLLGVSQASIEDTIQNLHSLLAVPADDQTTVKLLHLSFRDFLLDSERCLDGSFLVNETKQHGALLHRCLEVMSSGLRQDVCALKHPGALASDVDPSIVAQCIPAHLRYACVYWIDHLRGSKVQPGNNGDVHAFLRTHFLYWLEAMALIGKSGDGVQKIRELWDYLSSSPGNAHSEVLRQLVYDATRYSLTFKGVIATAPLQTYASALVFAPETSVIRRLFAGLIPSWVRQLPTVDAQWDALVQTLEGHSKPVDILDFSPDGRFLASGSEDGTVRLWAISTGEAFYVWENKPRVWRVGFSSNGRMLAAAFSELPMRLWDTETGALLNELGDDSARVSNMGWLSNSRTLVSVSRTGRFALWDAVTGALLRCVDLGDDFISVGSISPTGDLVAWFDMEGTLHLSRVDGGSATKPKVFGCSGHGVDFSPDGKLLTFKSSDDNLGIWDVETGQLLRRAEGLEGEFRHVGWIDAVSFSPDGRLVAAVKSTSFTPGSLRLWDVASGSLLHIFNSYRDSILAVGFSADGSRLFCTCVSLGVLVWDVASGTPLQTLTHHDVTEAKFSPEGGHVASASTDHTIRIWDATALSLAPPEKRDEDGVSRAEVVDLVRSPQGNLIALVFAGGQVEVRQVASGNCVSQFLPAAGSVGTITFSPNEKHIVSHLSYDIPVCVWDVETGEMLHAFGKGTIWYSLAFLHDGRLAAAGKILRKHEINCRDSDPIKVHIWDLARGDSDNTLAGDPLDIVNIAFAPDGVLLVTISEDKSIFLWDVRNRAQLHRLKRPEDSSVGFDTLLFSSDNRFLAAAGEYWRGLSVWDVPSGKVLQVLDMPSGNCALAFSPDGNSIAASSAGGGAVIWDVFTGISLWRYEGPCIFGSLWFSRDDTLETNWGQVDLACFRESMPSEKERDAVFLMRSLESTSEQGDQENFEEDSGEEFEQDFEVGFEKTTEGVYEHAHQQGYGEGYEEDNTNGSAKGYDESYEEATDVPASHTPSLIDEQTPDSDRDQLLEPGTAKAEQRLTNPLNMFIEGPWVMQGTQRALLLPSKYQANRVAAHKGAFTIVDTAGRVLNFVLGPVE